MSYWNWLKVTQSSSTESLTGESYFVPYKHGICIQYINESPPPPPPPQKKKTSNLL